MRSRKPGPTVAVIDEQTAVAVDVAHLGELARAVLVDAGMAGGELALSFLGEEAMAELNQQYLDGDGPTDVLAFPLDAPLDPPFDADDAAGDATDAADIDDAVPVLLGDVAVCPSVAEGNAAARAVATGDELALLVVHGVLHVLGMDHAETDEALAMQTAERRLLARLHPSTSDDRSPVATAPPPPAAANGAAP